MENAKWTHSGHIQNNCFVNIATKGYNALRCRITKDPITNRWVIISQERSKTVELRTGESRHLENFFALLRRARTKRHRKSLPFVLEES